jgi:hypothetical protein
VANDYRESLEIATQRIADGFVEHLFPGEGYKAQKIPEAAGKPDFEVAAKQFVFEVKRLLDDEKLKDSALLHAAQEKIYAALSSNPKLAKLGGWFHVSSKFRSG